MWKAYSSSIDEACTKQRTVQSAPGVRSQATSHRTKIFVENAPFRAPSAALLIAALINGTMHVGARSSSHSTAQMTARAKSIANVKKPKTVCARSSEPSLKHLREHGS
jgi:hypothetical protein